MKIWITAGVLCLGAFLAQAQTAHVMPGKWYDEIVYATSNDVRIPDTVKTIGTATFKNCSEVNNRIKDLAERNDLLYVYMYDVWKESETLTYSPDGIHPQTNGYELIYQKLFTK